MNLHKVIILEILVFYYSVHAMSHGLQTSNTINVDKPCGRGASLLPSKSN